MGPQGFPVPISSGGWTDNLLASLKSLTAAGLPTDALWKAALAGNLNWEDSGVGSKYPGGAGISDLSGPEQIKIMESLINTPHQRGGLLGSLPVLSGAVDAVQNAVGFVGDNPWLIPVVALSVLEELQEERRHLGARLEGRLEER